MVQTVGSSSFTVVTQGGLVQTVDTSGTTTYTKDGTTESGVSPGEFVSAFGTPDTTSPSQLDAQFVDIYAPGSGPGHPSGFGLSGHPATSATHGAPGTQGVAARPFGGLGRGPNHGQGPGVVGTVKTVTGDDIVVATATTSTSTVVVSDSTKYLGPAGSSGLGGVKVGDTTAAFGATDSSGDLDATVVIVGSATNPLPASRPVTGTASTPGFPPGSGTSDGTTAPPSWPASGSATGHPGQSTTMPTAGQGAGSRSFGGGSGTSVPPVGSPGPGGPGGSPRSSADGR